MKKYSPEEDGAKRRAAPSPTPPGMTENMYENQDEAYHYVTNHLQYLDLVLERKLRPINLNWYNS